MKKQYLKCGTCVREMPKSAFMLFGVFGKCTCIMCYYKYVYKPSEKSEIDEQTNYISKEEKKNIPPHDILECSECGCQVPEQQSYIRFYSRNKHKWFGICPSCQKIEHLRYEAYKRMGTNEI